MANSVADTYQVPQVANQLQKEVGTLMSRSVVPQAPGNATIGIIGCTIFMVILLAISIIFWSVGAAQGNPDLTLFGQVAFAKSLGILLIGGCLISCILYKKSG